MRSVYWKGWYGGQRAESVPYVPSLFSAFTPPDRDVLGGRKAGGTLLCQRSQTFLARGTSFFEDNFSWTRVEGYDFGMVLLRSVQPRSLTCAVHSRVCASMRI